MAEKKNAPRTLVVEGKLQEDLQEIQALWGKRCGHGIKIPLRAAVSVAVSIALPALKRANGAKKEASNG